MGGIKQKGVPLCIATLPKNTTGSSWRLGTFLQEGSAIHPFLPKLTSVERFVVGNGKPLVPKRLRELLLDQRTADGRHKTKGSAAM